MEQARTETRSDPGGSAPGSRWRRTTLESASLKAWKPHKTDRPHPEEHQEDVMPRDQDPDSGEGSRANPAALATDWQPDPDPQTDLKAPIKLEGPEQGAPSSRIRFLRRSGLLCTGTLRLLRAHPGLSTRQELAGNPHHDERCTCLLLLPSARGCFDIQR